MAQAPDRGLMGAGTCGAGPACFELDLQQNLGKLQYSPEVFADNMQVLRRDNRSVQTRIDYPAADFDRGVVADIVRGFENDPCRIHRLIGPWLVGNDAVPIACAE